MLSIIFILIHLFSIINGQFYLSEICFMTFDNAILLNDSSYPNASILLCPSSCYTMRYKTNQQEYPIYGNETYSGNSLVCKSAMHDGRVAPWKGENSPVLIQNISTRSPIFISTLRNGIISSKLSSSANTYRFINNRINESSIFDIAIEHRQYLYSQDKSSSITCRSKNDLYKIEPINIDNGWKYWIENRLKYFTFPWNMTRDEALTFCLNNNATLMYWFNKTEEDILKSEILTTIHKLFRYQRNLVRNDTLTFYIGLKKLNKIQQWESNILDLNDESIDINVNSMNNTDDDYCTIIQSFGENPQSFGLYTHKCDDKYIRGYPLCRLMPSILNEENDFIYRIESDNQPGNLTGVIDFCSELGGYPIYANNAYEWHLIQEIMLKDPNFNADYVYTGLISQTKQVTNSYWMPKNISYNNSLNYLWFASSRGSDRIGYHLSKARDESYYGLYDINPYSNLNNLRFCRKNNIKSLIEKSSSCNSNQCKSNCLNITLPSQTDDSRFGIYACYPKDSLASIVYTQSFPIDGDFIRPTLPMEYSVSLRRNYNESLTLSFTQIDKDLRYDCYEYFNMDRSSTTNDDIIRLNCDSSNTNNKTITGIKFKKNFNGLISIGLKERRLSAHHMRFIDYSDSGIRCNYQGIYHPYINQCICSPGFHGTQCEYSCPAGYYGQACDYHCEGDDDYCKGLLICLPDPYGCSCYSGWYGTNCNISCPSDHYGPDCSYKCSCSSCNRFSGICNCLGTECYQGPYSRTEIESRCKSSSLNLALIIALPIVSVFVIVTIIGGLLYWRKRRSMDEENLFENSRVRFSSDSYQSSIQQNQFQKDYNNILSERL